MEFEDELFSYFPIIYALFIPILEHFEKRKTFEGISPGVAAPRAAELIDKFAPKL
jgi:hypothetical protein